MDVAHRKSLPISWLHLLGIVLLLPGVVQGSDAAGIEFFEKHIRPLLVTHCYECHSSDQSDGGLSIDSRAGLLAGGDTGPAITPGKPDASLLIEAVGYKNLDLQMPPKNKLADNQIELLTKWVSMGAPDPRAEVLAQKDGPRGMSIEEGRKFWSMQPVANVPLPAVKDHQWVQTPVDAFVLARLEKEGLAPARPADRLTLLRRVTFDLTGLPPTLREIEAFLADDSPMAFARVVERLLESPAYGVRWGRHWLDVVRYADSNGLDENLAFGNAWRYRDYVVDAFNRDKPFDQFLIEQIAGDLIPEASEQSMVATGFLSLGAKVLAEPDKEKLFMDTIDEQLDTLGKTFMGMTIGCVRCHDHKFDPLKQTDYYALGAIFKSTRTFASTNTGAIKHWYEHSFASPEEEVERIKKIDAEISAAKSAASQFWNKQVGTLRADARQAAARYLVACTEFSPDKPLYELEQIAARHDLHPRILHHCRRHLEYHRDDPVFQPWHQLNGEQGAEGVRKYYEALFRDAEQAMADAKKQTPRPVRSRTLDWKQLGKPFMTCRVFCQYRPNQNSRSVQKC